MKMFLSLMGSLVHRRAYLKLGRFKRTSRCWSLSVANVGDGKSQCVDELRKAAEQCCETLGPDYYVGLKQDQYHFMESGTHATAIHKVRFCDSYLCMAIGDASRALDKKAADGKGTDKTMKICLESFLDAAHGNHVSHQTMDTRKGMMRDCKKKPKHPSDPYTDPVSTEMADTNVTCTLMCHDECFIDFFL